MYLCVFILKYCIIDSLPPGLDDPIAVCRLPYMVFFKLDRSLVGVPGCKKITIEFKKSYNH